MPADELIADYVVIGSGAVGMSFVDVILAESDATVIMIDRHARPGGHWNDAYPFVRLHQPSDFYGVSSTRLGRGMKDDRGPNAGMYELASGDEVRAYFDRAMHDTFLPTGRVRYFPMSTYDQGQVTSSLTGASFSVRARKRVVDARYVGSLVPSTEPPPFPAASGVDLVPVNELANLNSRHDTYVIIGAGKTSADACLWLLENGVDPSMIVWVRPRDAWFFNRAGFQGGAQTLGSFATQLEVVAKAQTLGEVFTGLEAAGQLMRVDPDHWPTMFRFATTSVGEIELLRQISKVVRLGRVVRIDEDALVLERGRITAGREWLYVDCSAAGTPFRPPVPVFDGKRITLQYIVYSAQPTYSAALTAFIELGGEDDEHKNAICRPLPVTGELLDVPRNLLQDLEVRESWFTDDRIRDWMSRCRLDPTTARGDEPSSEEREAALWRFLAQVAPARSSLEVILESEGVTVPSVPWRSKE
jgi:hypothetical protein